MKIIKNIKQKAFTLIETILVLGIATVIGITALQEIKRQAENDKANAAAEQFREIGAAVANYIATNYAALNADTFPKDLTIADLQAPVAFLPANFKTTSVFGRQYSIQIRQLTVGTQNYYQGIVASNGAWTDENNNVQYKLLGQAVRRLGAQGGMTFYSTTTATGLDNGWAETNASFPAISAAGQLVYRTFYGNDYDSIYYRRDGLYNLTGNMDANNQNINNAGNVTANTDITAGAFIRAADGLINSSLTVGAGANVTSIVGNQITTNRVTGAGADSRATFDNLVATVTVNSPRIGATSTDASLPAPAQTTIFGDDAAGVTPPLTAAGGAGGYVGNGYIQAKDVYLTGIRGQSMWLSEALPKYSSRGIYAVVQTDETLPPFVVSPVDCGNGTPKIEIIPQSSWTQARVLGSLTPTLTGDLSSGLTLSIDQDQYTVGANIIYAEPGTFTGLNGWYVHLTTPTKPQYHETATGTTNYIGGSALVHRYCDMGG